MEKLQKVNYSAALLRISTEKTDFSGKKVDLEATLKNHEEKIVGFFNEMGWQGKYDLYKEVLTGGTAYEDRKELQDLLNNIEKYDAIVVMELQRLSRQGEVSAKIKQKIIDRQALIITLNPYQVMDMAHNSMDALMYDIGSALSEYERRVASQRVKANKLSMARQGLNPSGQAPYGYFRNPATKKLEIDKNTVDYAKLIFQKYIEGMGSKAIANYLNKELGIPNANGKKWVNTTIRHMLENESYIGTLVYNGFEKKNGKREIVTTVRRENSHKPLIDKETWQQVQNLIKTRERRYSEKGRERERKKGTALDGLLYCSDCKRRLQIPYQKKKNANGEIYDYFYVKKCQILSDGKRCKNCGVNIKTVETAVLKSILNHKEKIKEKINSFEANDFKDYLKELHLEKEQFENLLKSLKQDMKFLREEEKEYKRSGIIDKDQEIIMKEDREENQKMRFKTEENLQKVEEKINNLPEPEEQIKHLQNKLNIIEELEKEKNQPVEEINRLLKRIILKIEYTYIVPEELIYNKKEREKIKPILKIEYID